MDLIVKVIIVVFAGLLALAAGIPIPKDVVALPIVPAFILPSTLIHPPTHESASIESHRLGGNFAYSVAEVHAESGLSPSERNKRIKMPVGMVDEIKWPEISKDQKRTSPSKIKKYS